jgi:hypothetical protein
MSDNTAKTIDIITLSCIPLLLSRPSEKIKVRAWGAMAKSTYFSLHPFSESSSSTNIIREFTHTLNFFWMVPAGGEENRRESCMCVLYIQVLVKCMDRQQIS